MDSEQRRQVGERLAIVRAQAGLSQKEMGERLSVSWRSYQNYELGMREPPLDMVSAVCEEFSVRFAWLIDGKGGQRSQRDFEGLRRIVERVNDTAESKQISLGNASRADIIVRLFKRLDDGFDVSDTEIHDYIELAGGNYE